MSDEAIVTSTIMPIVFFVFVIIAFLICREITLWYFRISEIVKKLDVMIQHLEIISRTSQPQQPQVEQPIINRGPLPGGLKGFNPKLPIP